MAAALALRAQTPHLNPTTTAASPAGTIAAAGEPDLVAGQKLYRVHCAGCHGPGGEGARGPTLATASLPRAATQEQLVRVIRNGIAGTEMPSLRLRPAEVRDVAGWVRHLGRLPAEPVTGDAKRGGELYATKGACAQCHTINGRGGALGPDLTDIGLRRGVASLRASLVDPAAELPRSFSTMRSEISMPATFVVVKVTTKDGRQVYGVRINEDTFSLQVRDLNQQIHSFFRTEIADVQKHWDQSPMPSYRDVFTKDELEDLIAYLVSLKGEQ